MRRLYQKSISPGIASLVLVVLVAGAAWRFAAPNSRPQTRPRNRRRRGGRCAAARQRAARAAGAGHQCALPSSSA